jgi:tripartite-type tricarboxylate transporter receptor subunit TctC
MPSKHFASVCLGLACLPVAAIAQDWPSKPVRIVVPFAPCGATDVVTRIFAQRFQETFG